MQIQIICFYLEFTEFLTKHKPVQTLVKLLFLQGVSQPGFLDSSSNFYGSCGNTHLSHRLQSGRQ